MLRWGFDLQSLHGLFTGYGSPFPLRRRAVAEMLIRQFYRYAIVGLASNGILYVGYLLLTSAGAGPKFSMSLMYGMGVLQTFIFNRSWTFAADGCVGGHFARYVAVYISGYFLNLSLLALFVDVIGFPHYYVQATLIFVVAVYIFTLQRYWVFRSS